MRHCPNNPPFQALRWVLCVAAFTLALPVLASTGGTVTGEVTARPLKARANVVVSLEKVPGAFRPPAQPITMDQRGLQFVPRVLPILRGTTVRFLNNDNVSHNVFSPDGDKYDLGTWPKGEAKTRVFTKPGVYRQLCNVHPEMEATIVVLENPFFAVTDEAGKFRIEGVPPGEWVVRAWSERLTAVTQKVSVTEGASSQLRFEMKKS